MSEICYIGIGSNIGNREQHLKNACDHLNALPNTTLLGASAIYETEPEGPITQPWFLNEVVALQTSLSPMQLMDCCLKIEKKEGRIRTTPKGPRTLDLDILLFGNQILLQKDLQIPHPRLTNRRFVLIPLSELAPLAWHPIFNKNLITLMKEHLGTQKIYPYPLHRNKQEKMMGEIR